MSASLQAPVYTPPQKVDLSPEVQQFINDLEPPGWYVLIQPEKPGYFAQPLADGVHEVGRDPDCDVIVSSPFVSRAHCRLRVEAKTVTLKDLSSRNGTKLNGQFVRGPEEIILAPDDQIVVAHVMLVLIKK